MLYSNPGCTVYITVGKKRRRRKDDDEMMWNVENVKVKTGVRLPLTKYVNEKPSTYLNANVLKLMPMVG